MSGDLQITGVRARPSVRRGAWSEWAAAMRHRRERARVEQAEVIERLATQTRHSRKAGRPMPGGGHWRRWS